MHEAHGHDQWRNGQGTEGHTWAVYRYEAAAVNAYLRAVARARFASCAREPRCAVRLASFLHHGPYRLIDAVVGCESGYRPDAANPSSSAGGLGQWLDSSWRSYSPRYGMGGRSRFEVWPAAYVTAGVISDGGISNWDASRHCWS